MPTNIKKELILAIDDFLDVLGNKNIISGIIICNTDIHKEIREIIEKYIK